MMIIIIITINIEMRLGIKGAILVPHVILLLLLLLLIAFMHGIYNYIPKTNHISTVHSVAAIL